MRSTEGHTELLVPPYVNDHLNPRLADREAYPYAVGVQMPGEEHPTYVHFASKPAADLYAGLMESPSNEVTRWVAVLDRNVIYSADIGWRKVTYFVL